MTDESKRIEILKEEETENGKKIEFFIHNEVRTFTDLLSDTLRNRDNVLSVASKVDHPILNKKHPKLFLEVEEGEPLDEIKKALKQIDERNQEWLEEIKSSLE